MVNFFEDLDGASFFFSSVLVLCLINQLLEGGACLFHSLHSNNLFSFFFFLFLREFCNFFYSFSLCIGSYGEVYHADLNGTVSSTIPFCSTYGC
jgi:hypothetical protein